MGIQRKIALRSQHYLMASTVMQNTDMAMTVPERFARRHELHYVELPVNDVPSLETHLYWHESTDQDPANRWMREQMIEICQQVTAQEQRAEKPRRPDPPPRDAPMPTHRSAWALSLALASLAQAETLQVEPLVITGSRYPASGFDLPFSVDRIEREQASLGQPGSTSPRRSTRCPAWWCRTARTRPRTCRSPRAVSAPARPSASAASS